MAELTTEQFEAARARGEARSQGPRAERAHYDAGRDRVIVRLTTGVEIGFAPRDAEGLEDATQASHLPESGCFLMRYARCSWAFF